MPKNRTNTSKVSAASARNRLTGTFRLSLATCLATATIATPALIQAQEAAASTGIITGRVQNAASGKYLNNARVNVVGTQIQAFTDESGEFQLNDVPAGSVTLKVFYTGLDPKEVTVQVGSGEILAREITLTSQDAYGTSDDTVQLEAFVVASAREREAAALAINEQRFAGNIKSVVSTDAFGDIAEGNIGEFMKYIPGITIDYVAADARSAGLNGLDPSYTTVSVNGNRLASAASGGTSRTFEFESATISSASRIEITKLPTPEQSAEGLAGSINLVPKNAFEFARPKLSINAYMGMHDEELHFRKTGGVGNKGTFKALPNFSFSYVNPLSKTLGFTISGQSSNQFVDQHRTAPTWNFAQGGASVTNPMMTNYTLQDGPKISYREGLSGGIDWKFAPGHVLSLTGATNYYETEFNNRNINFATGTTATPTIAGTGDLSFGPTFTQSANGRGTGSQGQSFRKKTTVTNNVALNYRFKGRLWEAEAGVNWSKSKGSYPLSNFESLNTSLLNPDAANSTALNVRFESDGSPFPAPDRITVKGTSGTLVNPFLASSYRVNSARIRPLEGTDSFRGVNFKAKRFLDFLPFYNAIKVGGELRTQLRDARAWQEDLTFNGINGSLNAAPFLDTSYLNEDNGFGFSGIQWISPYQAWAAYQANPALFTASANQQRDARKFYLQNSQQIEETVTAGFIQHEIKLIDNRLNIVYGVRYEKTEDKGQGLKTTRPPALNPIDTLDEVNTYWFERGAQVTKEYDGFYPSINANFTLREDIIIRAGFAKTFGRPNFGDIIPLARGNDSPDTINDGVGNINPYTVVVRNTGLKPYEADNYDLTIEHYLPKAGLISARGFIKDIVNFTFNATRPITNQDFDDFQVEGVDRAVLLANNGQIQSRFNSAEAARLSGIELTYRIAELPWIPTSFGKFGFFASYTNQHTSGAGADNFTNFAPRLINARLNYNKSKFSAAIGWNYTSQRRTSFSTSNVTGGGSNPYNFKNYIPQRSTIDLSADYKIDKTWSVFTNARNVFDEANSIVELRNDDSPAYSEVQRYETYGVLINIGVKAEF